MMYFFNRIKSSKISINQYSDFCMNADISPNYHPSFVEFYFGQLGKKKEIIGIFEKQGQLICAYPVLYGQVFPNSLHKRLLGREHIKLGDIAQPEALFPVNTSVPEFSINRFSPMTSPILRGIIKSRGGNYSLKSIAIAKNTKHKSVKKYRNRLLEEGGEIYFTDELDIKDFVDIYITLHGQQRNLTDYDLRYVKTQIITLYKHIFGCVLLKEDEPMATLLCYKVEGKRLYYIDAVNLGVKRTESHHPYESYGSILLLASLEKAEEQSQILGKNLRYSYGYYYGQNNYKKLWAQPEKTFIAF